MNEKHPVEEIAEAVGGTITEIGVLPDGSGFALMSMSLSENHWIYAKENGGFSGEPPMPFRIGNGPTREALASAIRQAGIYAVRASTMCGEMMDFDPDAMLQNLVVGFLGYWTEDGLSKTG